MKKIKVFLFALLTCLFAQAQDQITFTCEGVHDDPFGNGHPKTPILSPTVYIEDYTLSFETNHPVYVLYIKDENDVVVYSTIVTSAETLVTLPSTLSGEYKIELVMDNWLFTGWIDI